MLFNDLLLFFKSNVCNTRKDTIWCFNKLPSDITNIKEIGKTEAYQSQTRATQYNKKWRVTHQSGVV